MIGSHCVRPVSFWTETIRIAVMNPLTMPHSCGHRRSGMSFLALWQGNLVTEKSFPLGSYGARAHVSQTPLEHPSTQLFRTQ